MTIGQYIRQCREETPDAPFGKLTQERLAALVKFHGPPASQQLVSFWEKGKIVPRADHLEALAKVLPTSSLDRLRDLAADAEAARRVA